MTTVVVEEERPLFRQQVILAGDAFQVETSPISEKKKEIKHDGTPQKWKEAFIQGIDYHSIEENQLLQLFHRNSETANPSLILISGASGLGKSRLARSLKDHVRKGFFITGKYDILQRPEPYRAFVMALTDFTRQLDFRDEEEIKSLRKKIRESTDVSVLADMIPALKTFLRCRGQCQNVLKGNNAMQRFVFSMRSLLRCICSPENPLVLLIDDLHYADRCSLDILTTLVTDRELPGLVIVATVDDADISPSSYLSTKLREMEDRCQTEISNIKLMPLSKNSVRELLEAHLEMEHNMDDLANIVYKQSGGNFFHIKEMLRWLLDSKILVLTGSKDSRAWGWALTGCDKVQCRGCLNDFLRRKIHSLSSQSIEALKIASCFGSYVDPILIGHVLGKTIRPLVENPELVEHVLAKSVRPLLDEAVQRGILLPEGEGYAFVHEEMQRTVYSLIEDDDRELFHLEIGRRLWRKLTQEELDTHIFTVLSQIQIGSRLVTKDRERVAIAYQCAHAGTQACKASAFRVALVYFQFGINLLPERSWRDEYSLTLSLYSGAAEMAMTIGKYDDMDAFLAEVFENGRSMDDKLSSYGTKISSLSMIGKQDECLDLGIWALKQIGETFPRRHCMAAVIREFTSVNKMLKGKSDEQLLRLPELRNKQKLQALQILQLMVLSAITSRPKFGPFVLLKMMKITVEHGLSIFASGAFALHGMLCIAAFRDADIADRYGKLGLRLLDRYESVEYLPRVYAAYYGVVYSWKYPIKGALEPLLRANAIAFQTGDNEYSALCANLYKLHAIETDIPLAEITKTYDVLKEAMIATNQQSLLQMVQPAVYTLNRLMGVPSEPPRHEGAYLTEMSCRYSPMQVSYFFNNIDEAGTHLDTVFREIWMTPPTFEQASGVFFCGLVALALARRGTSRQKHLKMARKALRWITEWSKKSQHNLLDKRSLLEAEKASVKGDNTLAYEKYLIAIALARQEGFLQIHAIAEERFARHLLSIDKEESRRRFETAIVAYKRWGAVGRSDALQAEIDNLFKTT